MICSLIIIKISTNCYKKVHRFIYRNGYSFYLKRKPFFIERVYMYIYVNYIELWRGVFVYTHISILSTPPNFKNKSWYIFSSSKPFLSPLSLSLTWTLFASSPSSILFAYLLKTSLPTIPKLKLMVVHPHCSRK